MPFVPIGTQQMTPEGEEEFAKKVRNGQDEFWGVPRAHGNRTSFQENEHRSVHGYGIAAFRAAMDAVLWAGMSRESNASLQLLVL